MAVVYRWSLLRGSFSLYTLKSGAKNNGRCRQVVARYLDTVVRSGLTVISIPNFPRITVKQILLFWKKKQSWNSLFIAGAEICGLSDVLLFAKFGTF